MTTMITVADLTALKALTPSAGDTAYMKGYYAADDGGEGVFDWNSGSTAADNGGTIIQPTAGGNGRWIRSLANAEVTVRQFGAKGDGSTDDTTAISNAVAYWKSADNVRLVWPSGTYPTTAAINFENPVSEMVGTGFPVIKYTGTAATNVFSVLGTANNTFNQRIKGIAFDGGANARGTLYIHRVYQSVFEDIEIRGAATGYQAVQTGFSISNVFRNLAVSNARTPTHTYSNRPHNGVIIGLAGSPSGSQTIDCVFDNLIVESVASTGIGLINALDNLFIGGTIEGNGGPGMILDAGQYGNTFIDMFFEWAGTDFAPSPTFSQPDVYLYGDHNSFINCEMATQSSGHKSLEVSGNRNRIQGGVIGTISNTGSGNTFEGIRVSASGGWVDAGTNTKVVGAYNDGAAKYYGDSLSSPTGVIYRSGSAQSYSGGSFAQIAFNATSIDVGGVVDIANSRIVIAVPGIYELSGAVYLSGGIASGDILQAQITVGGGGVNFGRIHAAAASDLVLSLPSRPVVCAAGDVITMEVAKTGAATTIVNTAASTWLSVSRRV